MSVEESWKLKVESWMEKVNPTSWIGDKYLSSWVFGLCDLLYKTPSSKFTYSSLLQYIIGLTTTTTTTHSSHTMSLHLNRSIRPFLRSTSLSSSLPRPVHPTSSARLPGLPSSRSQSQASGQSTGPRTGIGQLLADLNLTYTLPLSFAIGIGLYAYLQSQLPDDIESTRTTRISSKEPLPALIDLPQSNHKSIIG